MATLAAIEFDIAKDTFIQAADPPDPNFTELIAPEFLRFPDFDAMPDGSSWTVTV